MSASVRVAHVPARHTYVEHSTTRPGAMRPGSTPAGQTGDGLGWPGAGAWLRANGDDVDVVHAHFGFEQCSVDGLERVLLDLDRRGLPLVWTAHDLTNPHLVDQSVHTAQLALLARHATGVLTLTDGAAGEIAGRWGRRAEVVPHPHLAPPAELDRPRREPDAHEPAVVVVPLGMLRPATDRRVVLALLDAFGSGPHREDGALLDGPLVDAAGRPVLLQVWLRSETLRAGFPRPDTDLTTRLRTAADEGRIDLRVTGRTPEAQLWTDLREVSALVLPYRWGSHSGWVEACHDVGTPVVAPSLGHWGEQHPVHAFGSGHGSGDDGVDLAGLQRAVADALAAGPRRNDVADERLAERERVVAAHADLHARAARGDGW